MILIQSKQGRIKGEGAGGAHPPEMTCGFLIQLVFYKKKKTMWFIGVEVEQETSTPPPEKNPGSAPAKPVNTDNNGALESVRINGVFVLRG